MSDPYRDPQTGVLINTLGIKNDRDLARAEYTITHLLLAELGMTPIAGTFDLPHLEAIHRHLFSDIYAWAGQTRTVNVGKRDPDDPRWMSTFAPANRISEGVHATHQFLSERNQLKGLTQKEFTTALAATYVTLNYLHPFPEGNGRSSLTMLAQLAREAEYRLDYTKIRPQAWNRAASRSSPQRLIEDPTVARSGDPTLIHEVFRHIVEPLNERMRPRDQDR